MLYALNKNHVIFKIGPEQDIEKAIFENKKIKINKEYN